MSHVRQQIRDTITTALAGAVTLVSARVYASRFYPLRDGNVPGICVYTLNETSERLGLGPSHKMRVVNVVTDIYVAATVDADDDLDDIAVQVEGVIGANPTLSGIAKDATLASTDIELSADGETPFVLGRLIWTVQYVTSETDAATAL